MTTKFAVYELDANGTPTSRLGVFGQSDTADELAAKPDRFAVLADSRMDHQWQYALAGAKSADNINCLIRRLLESLNDGRLLDANTLMRAAERSYHYGTGRRDLSVWSVYNLFHALGCLMTAGAAGCKLVVLQDDGTSDYDPGTQP